MAASSLSWVHNPLHCLRTSHMHPLHLSSGFKSLDKIWKYSYIWFLPFMYLDLGPTFPLQNSISPLSLSLKSFIQSLQDFGISNFLETSWNSRPNMHLGSGFSILNFTLLAFRFCRKLIIFFPVSLLRSFSDSWKEITTDFLLEFSISF